MRMLLRSGGVRDGLLTAGRIDHFPSPILHLDAEMADCCHPELEIAPDLMLQHPAAARRFVGPRQPELAACMKTGLTEAATDGSFQRLLRKQCGAVFEAHPHRSATRCGGEPAVAVRDPCPPPRAAVAAERADPATRPAAPFPRRSTEITTQISCSHWHDENVMTSTAADLPRRTLLLGTLAAPLARAESVRVWLPQHMSTADPQLPYVRRLVLLALERAGTEGDVELVKLEMYQGRSLMELASGKSAIDVMWTMTDREREASGVLTVRIPIDRGLMGWRVLLVRRTDLPRWAALQSVEALKNRVAGQGHDWPDTAILRANGLRVSTSSSYEALFRMLSSGRFDYFPRAVLEVDAELVGNRHPSLAVVPNLMLYYPAAAYLFVSPRRPQLAELLRTGLEKAVADGSMQQLHRTYFGGLIKAYAVSRDRVLKLRNPLLPPETPLQRRELWLQPGESA
jgi:hypothetical protein